MKKVFLAIVMAMTALVFNSCNNQKTAGPPLITETSSFTVHSIMIDGDEVISKLFTVNGAAVTMNFNPDNPPIMYMKQIWDDLVAGINVPGEIPMIGRNFTWTALTDNADHINIVWHQSVSEGKNIPTSEIQRIIYDMNGDYHVSKTSSGLRLENYTESVGGTRVVITLKE